MKYLEIILDVLKSSLTLTCLVMIMMLLIEFVNVGSAGKWMAKLQHRPFMQILLATLLGLVPGCIGGFAIVSLSGTFPEYHSLRFLSIINAPYSQPWPSPSESPLTMPVLLYNGPKKLLPCSSPTKVWLMSHSFPFSSIVPCLMLQWS